MITAKIHKQTKSKFGNKLQILHDEKKAIGKEAVEKVLWPDGRKPRSPLYFSDGTSASFSFCYFLKKLMSYKDLLEDVTVRTPNLDIAMQVMLQPGAEHRLKLEMSPGVFDFSNCGLFGKPAVSFSKKQCQESTCVMAVTALDAELGPCGRGEEAKATKKAMLEQAKVLVILADHKKLAQPSEPADAANPTKWQKWLSNGGSNGRLYVITDEPSGIGYPYQGHRPCAGFPDNRSNEIILLHNLAELRRQLGRQLITVASNSVQCNHTALAVK